MNPKSLLKLQTKGLRLLVELINGDVERPESMRRLLVETIRRILAVPFKGDSQDLLMRVLRFFESSCSQLEILDLIDLFLRDCESKRSLKSYIFGREFSFLEKFDFLKLYFDFLSHFALRLVDDLPRLSLFFSTLENLLMKQARFDALNTGCFLKLWKFICGNHFQPLKQKFHEFVISNYSRFLQKLSIFPHLFSKKSLEELATLKLFYSQAPAGQHSEQALRSFMKHQERLPDISMTGTDLGSLSERECPEVLGPSEQFLFRILFLLENHSIGKLRLLSMNLSDEMFVSLCSLDELRGFPELWHAVKFLPQTDSLSEFLLKLYRCSGFNHLVFPLSEGERNLTKLAQSGLDRDQLRVVKKYYIRENQMQVQDHSSADNPLQEIAEKKQFELCNKMINNLKSGIEHGNFIVIKNMLRLLRRFLFTGFGFLGHKASALDKSPGPSRVYVN